MTSHFASLNVSCCVTRLAGLLALLPGPSAPAQTADAPGALILRVVEKDAGGAPRPVPCRVHLGGPDGKPVRVPGLPFFHDHVSCEGEVRLTAAAAGRYDYVIERGPEYRRTAGQLEVPAAETAERRTAQRTVELERWIDLAALGWWSGETHIHRPLEDVPLLVRAEDLHVAPVMTQWNQRCLWSERPLPTRLLLEPEPGRAIHVLGSEDERQGGALLYLNLAAPLELGGDGPEHPSPVVHLKEALEQPSAWVDVEKPFWWDMPAWVATGKVRSIGLANNHMCRSTMYANEAWGRPRDAARLPPPRGNGFYTQELYYQLLNCGFRIPPSAGSASGVLPNPVGYNRVYVQLDGPFRHDAWWEGLGAGRCFVTNGPLLLAAANGRPPGAVFRAAEGGEVRIALDLRLGGNDPIEAVEVIRDGEVVERIAGEGLDAAPVSAWLVPRPLVFQRSGWLLVRAIARVPETFRFASTAPFYVEVGSKPRRISRTAVEFFLAWLDERLARLERSEHLRDPAQREGVLAPHREARKVFAALLPEASE
jgi:hypothetical protein